MRGYSSSMACHSAYYSAFSPSPFRDFYAHNLYFKSSTRYKPLHLSSYSTRPSSYSTLVSEAAGFLVPPASFEASKLNVVFLGEGMESYCQILPRTYILSHCDFTANLTLTISNVISPDQLRGWYIKDDVVAEWKKVKDDMRLHVHCYVNGPNILRDLAAEFRYHIFSKEMPLVLKAVLHGDSILFREHPELTDALVWVYFHSSSKNYNRIECWGPLMDAAQGRREDPNQRLLTANNEGSLSPKKWKRPKSIFEALFAFLL